MQMIINISEHNKSVLERYMDGTGYNRLPIPVTNAILEAVNSGKVLPKGHGNLIDISNIDVIELEDSTQFIRHTKGDEVDVYISAPIIIEADRSEE
jgi:hypothetical protein